MARFGCLSRCLKNRQFRLNETHGVSQGGTSQCLETMANFAFKLAPLENRAAGTPSAMRVIKSQLKGVAHDS